MKRKRSDVVFNSSALKFLGEETEDYRRACRLIAPFTTLPSMVENDTAKMARLMNIGARDNKDGTYVVRIEFEWFMMNDMLFLTEIPLIEERAFIDSLLDDKEVVDGRERRVFQLIMKRENQ